VELPITKELALVLSSRFLSSGAPYSSAAVLNIGQHNFAAGPTGAFTYLSDKARWEASSKADYIANFKDGTRVIAPATN